MQNSLMINKLKLSDFEFNIAIGLRQRCSEFKKERNRMKPMNTFDDYLTRVDITETILRLDRIAC